MFGFGVYLLCIYLLAYNMMPSGNIVRFLFRDISCIFTPGAGSWMRSPSVLAFYPLGIGKSVYKLSSRIDVNPRNRTIGGQEGLSTLQNLSARQ
jgi:hypothetical protein